MTASAADARREPRAVLESAARAALRAPSVYNTQPWTWRISGSVLELSADPDRRLPATDREGRLLLLSCGGALHHARTVLSADGWTTTVQRMPGDGNPELLARLRLDAPASPDPRARLLARAISRRRTDRRAYGDRPVAAETLTGLVRVAEAQGAYLHVVPPGDVPLLGIAEELAAGIETADPEYRSELTRWTTRPAWTGDGVPPATAVETAVRRVPVRNYAPHGAEVLPVGPGHDEGATFAVLYGPGAGPIDLLRAGEAMSALLLTATAEGLSTAVLSEAVEVGWPRHLLRDLLSGLGEPYLVVRLGYVESDATLPATPRRTAADAITFAD